MKRDMNLIRELLLAIEKTGPRQDSIFSSDDFPDKNFDEIAAHLVLMHDAGFIGRVSLGKVRANCSSLTWEGHEFLELARSEAVWKQALSMFSKQSAGITLDLLKAALKKLTLSNLGMD